MTRKNTKKSNDTWQNKIESVAPNIVFFVLLPLLTAELAFMMFHGSFSKNEKQNDNRVYKDTMLIEATKQDSIINYQNAKQR